jgi:hypothetical protein
VKPLSIISEGTVRNKNECRKMNSCGNVIYMGDIQGPEKVNDTCMETIRAETMDIGVNVYIF